MSRFSEHFASRQGCLEDLCAIPAPARSIGSIVEAAEKRRGLEPEDAASLLAWGQDPDRRAEIRMAAGQLRDQVNPRNIEFVIPEYLTSFCQNDCLYCGFRKTNPLAERVRLSLEKYEQELDLILSWGYRQIELVLADDPEFGADRLVPYIELTSRKLAALGGGRLALNAPPYEEDDYRRLRAAGLDWVALWQETYDQPHFDRWHFVGSPKRHYEFRLDVWDRAVSAGFRDVALGVLFGLYDWRYDVLALIEHGNYLRRTYGIEPHALGIPRLKPARGVLASQKPSRFSVSDEDYQLAVSVYHLAFPRTRLFFNTREDYEFNLSMLASGDLFTVDCETLPGAYLRGRLPGQFATHCYPPRGEVRAALERRGFACQYLQPETAATVAGSRAKSVPPAEAEDVERWTVEQEEIHSRLAAWEYALEGLKTTSRDERYAAASALRDLLNFFETVVIEHCRYEETVLFKVLSEDAPSAVEIPVLTHHHERFAADLDKFRRQVDSYELSGDPSVLLTLGSRIIREFRAHLEAEEGILENWPDRGLPLKPRASRA
jgi:2-iminoacetate synthase